MLSVRWKRRGGLADPAFVVSGKVDKLRLCLHARDQAEICSAIALSLKISAADVGMALGDSVSQAKETGAKIQLPDLTDLISRATLAKRLAGSETPQVTFSTFRPKIKPGQSFSATLHWPTTPK